MKPKLSATLFAAVLLLGVSQMQAAEPAWTAINVKDTCCAGCAQKIASRVYAVRGVKEMRVDIAKRIVYVAPQQNAVLSPRALWEAVEKAKDVPLHLAGPSGEFDKKPSF